LLCTNKELMQHVQNGEVEAAHLHINLPPKDLCSMTKINNKSIPSNPIFHTMQQFTVCQK